MDSVVEDAIITMRDFIRNNYNSYLNSINDAKSDGITAEDIKSGNITLNDVDPYSHNEYPIMDIYPTDIIAEPLSAGADALYIDYTALIALNKGSESESTRKSSRYVEALRGILRDYADLGASTWDLAPDSNITVSIYPSPESEIKISTVQWRTIQDVTA